MTVYFYHFSAFRKVREWKYERTIYRDGIIIMTRPAVMDGYRELREIVARTMFDGNRDFTLQSMDLVHRQGPAADVDCTDIIDRYPARVITEWPQSPLNDSPESNPAHSTTPGSRNQGRNHQQASGHYRNANVFTLLLKGVAQGIVLLFLVLFLMILIGNACYG